MASPTRDMREGRTVATAEPEGGDEEDNQRRRRDHRGRREDRQHHRRREHRERDKQRHDGHHDKQPRPDQARRPPEERDASVRHSTRRGHHYHREERQHREPREHRDHRHGHDSHDRHSRNTEASSSRHHRRHGSPHHDKLRDHHNTQMVLFHKDDQGRVEKPKDGYREAKGDSDDTLFALDTLGDSLVWQFGTNDARRVPTYDRYGHGRTVLGTHSRFMFSHEGSKIVFGVEPAHGSGGSIFREKNNALLLRALQGSTKPKSKREHGTSRIEPSLQATSMAGKATADEADFVPLRATKKRKRGSEAGSESDSEGHRSNQNTDSDSTDESDSSSVSSGDEADVGQDNFLVVGDDTRENLKRRLSELSRRVKEEPQDVDAWLELVDLQDQQSLLLGNDDIDQEIAGSSSAGQHARSKDEITGISTMKLSIIESALRQVQSSSDRERLQLAIMREGAKVWTAKRLAQRWTDLARDNASGSGLSFLLWKARLDFEMTSLSTLTVDGIKFFMTSRVRALEKEAAESKDDVTRQTDLYSQIIYVFLRATRFLYDAGFRDLAAAAWQATLESSFARPPADVEGASLGQFWDSEIQRIGEEGAQGWRSYAAKVQGGEDAEEALLEYNVQNQTLPNLEFAKLAVLANQSDCYDMDEYKPLYEAWVVAERQRASLAKLPARVIDDIDDGGFEDVFRVAVFSDFETLLFRIPEALLPTLKPLLIDAFLLFCQLPPAFATSTWTQTARNDPFLAIIVLSGNANTAELDPEQDLLTSTGRNPPDLFYDGSRVVGSPDVLFSLPGWFRYLPDWLRLSTSTAVEAPVPPHWVVNTLRQLVRSFGFGELAPYSLAVDAVVNPTSVKKAARALLKQYISNTALYEAYALAEVSRGNANVARSVLASATANIADVEAELSLRQTWAWIELESGQKDAAIRRLVLRPAHDDANTPSMRGGSEGDQPISPAELLRLRHTLRTGMDYGLSAGLVRRAALFAQSFVLLEYLSSTAHVQQRPQQQQQQPERQSRQGNLSAATAAATIFSEEMQARGHGTAPIHESFLQGLARVVYFHATHGPYRPADLQAPLRTMVTLYPQNGIFLRLFTWIDPTSASGLSRLRPDNPLQQILDNVVLTRDNDCPSSRAFAIRHALQSGHGQGHAARAAFERALGGSNGSSDYNLACLGNGRLWQAFVHLTAMEAMATATTTTTATTRGGEVKRARVRGVDKKMVALAKDVYYRAVRACPGSKDVLLEAFGPNTGLVATTSSSDAGMSPSDLRAVFHTVVSKGLRVHMDLAEVRDRAMEVSKKYKT